MQIRQLKSEKANKETVAAEVKTLLSLKEDYKKATGKDWAPGNVDAPQVVAQSNDASGLNKKIVDQGNKIRKLKGEKANKDTIAVEVKVLLALKEDFKKATGKEWTPETAPVQPTSSANMDTLNQKIIDQGNKVRKLKAGEINVFSKFRFWFIHT